MNTDQDCINVSLLDGTQVAIRPLRKSDVRLERDFIMSLSPQSRRFRFLDSIASPSDDLLEKLTTINEATEAAFIALVTDKGTQREIAVARMSAVGSGRAEFAVAVSDNWQRKGLASLLTARVIDAARQHNIHTLFSIDAADNVAMRDWSARLGFRHATNPEDSTEVIHTLDLDQLAASQNRRLGGSPRGRCS